METQGDSPFFTFLSSGESHHIRDIILEKLVMGEGGPQAILNLRKVCSFTKEWIDTLDNHTWEKVFFRIPISFTINPENIQKFHENPPPPGATSIILRDNGEKSSNTRHLKDTFPTFFTFWEKKMIALVTDDSMEPLISFGPGADIVPQNLKYFQSNCDFDFYENLINWEHIEVAVFEKFENLPDFSFFSKLASIKTLKRLEISFGFVYNRQSINGFQLLIDTKRHDPDFTLKLHLDILLFKEEWESVFGALLSSPCKFQLSMNFLYLFSVLDKFDFDEEKHSKLLQAVYQLEIWHDSYESLHVRLNYLNLSHFFPNLKKFKWEDCVRLGTPEDTLLNNLCSNIANNLPKGLEFLNISRMAFISPSLPESLTYINLSMEEYLLSPCDCRNSLYLISEHCPLLNKLKVITRIRGLSEWKMDHPKSHSFCNLKSLSLGMKFGPKDTDATVCTSKLLLEVFQINQIPALLKFNLSLCKSQALCKLNLRDIFVFVIDSYCAAAILDSPLAKSLVKLKLYNTTVAPDGKEMLAKFQSVVDENEKRRHAAVGRQGRRKDFFN